MSIIGVDLGGTKAAAAVFSNSADMLEKKTKLLSGATGDRVGELVVELIRELIASQAGETIEAVGICVPGIVYSKKGTVWAPNIPGWEDYPLEAKIRDGLGIPGLKVCVESDRTCYILGEAWKGAARGCDNAIYLAVGTGIGAGILLDGRIIHGANDIVGATGWMALQSPYVDEYIPCGCFEYYASGTGIGGQAKLLYGDDTKTSYDVFAGYGTDPVATKILDKAVELWGMGTANLVSLFNPEKIIFGGGIFGPAVRFIDRIYAEACRWGQPISMKDVKYCASEVGSDAALLGAAHLALRATK